MAAKKTTKKKTAKKKAVVKDQDPVRENAGFYEMTGAMLVWGRKGFTNGTAEQLLEFFDAAQKLCDHPDYRVVPAHDLTRFREVRARKENRIDWVIGIKVDTAIADDGPSRAISFEDARERQRIADEILDEAFWERFDVEAFGDHGRFYGDVEGNRITENAAILVPFGPLAGGRLVFGKVVPEDTQATGDMTVVHGVDMEQGRRGAVLGVRVAAGDDWDTDRVDLSDAAHQARVARVGDDGRYVIVARYD